MSVRNLIIGAFPLDSRVRDFWYRSAISAVLSDETPDETTRVPEPIVSIRGQKISASLFLLRNPRTGHERMVGVFS